MPIDNAANWFVRLMAMAFAMSFASGVALLGYWMLVAIAHDPTHVEPFRTTLLLACVATVGLLLYAMVRIATWNSTRAEGNLLPLLLPRARAVLRGVGGVRGARCIGG